MFDHQTKEDPAGHRHRLLPGIAAAYGLLVIYGSLFPLMGWTWPEVPVWSLIEGKPRYLSVADVITNFLVYVPLGLLVAASLPGQWRTLRLIGTTLAVGAGLSLVLEALQLFLPNRITAATDLLMNSVGAGAGSILFLLFSARTASGRHLLRLRREWIRDGRLADLGLAILGLWALSQLSPLVPSLDMDSLRDGINPLWQSVRDSSLFDGRQTVVYTLYVAGLGYLTHTLMKPGYSARYLYPGFTATVLMLQVPVVTREVSLEALTGLVLGCALFLVARQWERQRAASVGIIAIVGAYLASQLDFSLGHDIGRGFNWIPFRTQIGQVTRLGEIIAGAWPFLAIAYLAMVLKPRRIVATATIGGLIIVVATFTLEWLQMGHRDRYSDITYVILALSAWVLPWLHPSLREQIRQRANGRGA